MKSGKPDLITSVSCAALYHDQCGGGKKANGGQDIGYGEGQTTPEDALEQWEGLGKPGGSKPREEQSEDYYEEEE